MYILHSIIPISINKAYRISADLSEVVNIYSKLIINL